MLTLRKMRANDEAVMTIRGLRKPNCDQGKSLYQLITENLLKF
jgi:hypothetical protein